MSTTVSNTSNSTASGSAPSGGLIGANGDMSSLFTTLLVAQIKHQDPLQPNDPSQFVAQLAQLSQVQSMQQMASQGRATNSALNSLQMMSLGAQVGSTVRASVNQLQLNGLAVNLHANLGSNSSSNVLQLTGADGIPHSVAVGALAAGDQALTIDPVALGLPAGTYSVQLLDASQQPVALEAEAALAGVRLAGDGSVFAQLQGVGEVSSSAITQLKGQKSTTASKI